VAGTPRAACTLLRGDIVDPDQVPRVVDRTYTDLAPPTSPYVTIHFTDGSICRLPAGEQLPVARPS
jgi:hypothetical protein